jgi:hypothetical protein
MTHEGEFWRPLKRFSSLQQVLTLLLFSVKQAELEVPSRAPPIHVIPHGAPNKTANGERVHISELPLVAV